MPNPTPDLDLVTLVWRGTYLDGTAATGTIELTYDGGMMLDPHTTSPISIFPTTLSKTLTAKTISVTNAGGTPVSVNVGEAIFEVPATNDPDITGGGGTYTVKENLNKGGGRTFSFIADIASPGATIYLNAIAPALPSPGVPYSGVTAAEVTALTERVDALEVAVAAKMPYFVRLWNGTTWTARPTDLPSSMPVFAISSWDVNAPIPPGHLAGDVWIKRPIGT